jgi:cyclase
MKQLSKNVYVETEVRISNNTFVVTGEGVVMVDVPMQPDDAVKMREQIAKLGKLKYLINSEPHLDHFATNCYFDTTIVSHEGSRKTILAASVDEYKKNIAETAPQCTSMLDGFYFKPPSVTFSEEMTLYLGNHTFRLIHLPGHSPYQMAVFIPEERIICTSDNVVFGQPPFLHDAVPFEWLESLKKLEQLDADILIPGHGPVCDKKYLKEMSGNIQAFIDAVSDAVKKGWTLDEAKQRISLADRYPPEPEKTKRRKDIENMGIARLYKILQK